MNRAHLQQRIHQYHNQVLPINEDTEDNKSVEQQTIGKLKIIKRLEVLI